MKSTPSFLTGDMSLIRVFPVFDLSLSAAEKAEQYGLTTAIILIIVWLSSVIEISGDTSHEDPYKTHFSCTEDALLSLQESQNNLAICHL